MRVSCALRAIQKLQTVGPKSRSNLSPL